MRPRTRHAVLTAAIVGSLLATASPAVALPGDPDPGNCATKITGTMSASPTVVSGGASTTVSWNVSEPALCVGEASYRLGTSFLTGQSVSRTGSKVYQPVISTTYRLYADFGSHHTLLASRTVSIAEEVQITIKLNTFEVKETQEASGDEPWLMVFPIVVDGRTVDNNGATADTARVFSASRSHRNLDYATVHRGMKIDIPANTGQFATSLQPIRGLPTTTGKKAAMVALMVVAMEEDATSDADADAGRIAIRNAIQREVDAVLKNRTWSTQAAIDANHADIWRAAERAVLSNMQTITMSHPFDSDDLIQLKYFFVSQYDLGRNAGTPVNMTFWRTGADYRIAAMISAH